MTHFISRQDYSFYFRLPKKETKPKQFYYYFFSFIFFFLYIKRKIFTKRYTRVYFDYNKKKERLKKHGLSLSDPSVDEGDRSRPHTKPLSPDDDYVRDQGPLVPLVKGDEAFDFHGHHLFPSRREWSFEESPKE